MKTKIILAAAAVAVIGCVVAGAFFKSTPPAGKTAPEKSDGRMLPAAATTEVAAAPTTSAPEKIEAAADTEPPPAKSEVRSSGVKPADAAQAEPPITINGYELQDPLARVALNFVGADPEADAYWMGAINDSAMPAEERKDLIEDLNEDGLSDPRHPAAQDLPLILARIRLIERLAPRAMDDVNRDAFAEAYKDLVGLLNGQPPQ